MTRAPHLTMGRVEFSDPHDRQTNLTTNIPATDRLARLEARLARVEHAMHATAAYLRSQADDTGMSPAWEIMVRAMEGCR